MRPPPARHVPDKSGPASIPFRPSSAVSRPVFVPRRSGRTIRFVLPRRLSDPVLRRLSLRSDRTSVVFPSCFVLLRPNEEERATAETHAGPHPVADGLRPGRQQRTADNDGIEGNHPLRRPAPFSHLHRPFALPHHGCASTRPHPSPGLLFHLLRRAVRSCPRSIPHLRAQCTRFFFILDSRTGAVHFHPIPENRTRFPISYTASAVRSDGFSGPAFCTRTPVSNSRSPVPACIRANHAANGSTKTRCRRAESRRPSTDSPTGRVPERLRYSTTYEIVMSQELQIGRQCGRFAERRTAASVPVKTAKLRMAEQKRKKACGIPARDRTTGSRRIVPGRQAVRRISANDFAPAGISFGRGGIRFPKPVGQPYG